MRQSTASVFLSCLFVLNLVFACPHTAAQTNEGKLSPVLKLRIATDQEEYALNEKVLVKYELTNVSNQTICLPPPDLKCEDTKFGSITTKANLRPATTAREIFICNLCAGGWGHSSTLSSTIKKSWIRIAPNETYTTESTALATKLDAIGQWQLEARYHEPQSATAH